MINNMHFILEFRIPNPTVNDSSQLSYTDTGMQLYTQFPSLFRPQFHNTSYSALRKLGSLNTVFK
jgi:hypothetical protein